MPLFSTFADMQAEAQEAEAQYAADHAAICARFETIEAVIKGDGDELAKFAAADLELAKAHVEQHGEHAKTQAVMDAGRAVLEAVHRRNARMFGVGEMSKRTQRFASAQARRYAGPPSAVTKIESKRK